MEQRVAPTYDRSNLTILLASLARLVYEGLALAYRRYSKKYVPEEDEAKAAKRGLWAGEFAALGIGVEVSG